MAYIAVRNVILHCIIVLKKKTIGLTRAPLYSGLPSTILMFWILWLILNTYISHHTHINNSYYTVIQWAIKQVLKWPSHTVRITCISRTLLFFFVFFLQNHRSLSILKMMVYMYLSEVFFLCVCWGGGVLLHYLLLQFVTGDITLISHFRVWVYIIANENAIYWNIKISPQYFSTGFQ